MDPGLQAVCVVWEDASVLDSETWVDRASMPEAKATIFSQVGFLLEDTKDHIVLTCTMGDRLIGSRTRIPRGMVRSVTPLAPARRRARA